MAEDLPAPVRAGSRTRVKPEETRKQFARSPDRLRGCERHFDGYTFIRRSDRHGEVRYQIFGYVRGREIAVACTLRGEQCWIISARRARQDERRKYYRGLAERSPTRED